MDIESDNLEDLKEIESRLYSQVFHDNVDRSSDKESLVLNDITSSMPNHKILAHQKKRYWVSSENKNRPTKLIHNRFKQRVEIKSNSTNEVMQPETKNNALPFLKPFEPYEPIIFNTQLKDTYVSGVKVENSSNFQESYDKKYALTAKKNTNKNLSTELQGRKKIENQHKKKLHQNSKIIHSYRNIATKSKMTTANQVKQKKLESIKRIREKKGKSQNIRDKIKQNEEKGKVVEIVLLDETDVDEDNDDVICIPISPPPLIAIDESDNEKNEYDIKENNSKSKSSIEKDTIKIDPTKFTKSKNKKCNSAPASTVQSNDSSRCTSPCSVFSNDDFISQREKSRLLQNSNVNDDDLALTETVDSFVSRQSKPAEVEHVLSNQKNCIMPPPLDIRLKIQTQNNKKNSKEKYLVKENDYRSVDVYDESESDLSVYSKGSISNKRQINSNRQAPFVLSSSHSISSSSSLSDSCQVDVIQKVKRLRKRRGSSNKGSDKKNSESESENEINKTSTGLPYITKGEAVVSVKKRRRASEPNLNDINDGNFSDNEFISKLSKIVQKNKTEKMPVSSKNVKNNRNESEISDDADEGVSARKIAEEVIKKSQQNKCEKKKKNLAANKSSNNIEEFLESNVVVCNEESPRISPELCLITKEKLKDVYEEIDNLNFKSEICREVTPEMVSLDITKSDSEHDEKEIERNETNFKEISDEVNGIVYYRIDSHPTDNIGWCEEMYRFYNMSWGGEKFSVKKIKQTLDRKANWHINSNDRFPKFTKLSRVKCFNCCEFGHISSKCMKPRKPIVCYMCGEQGHREPRCPNTICLKCGAKTSTYTRQCVKCIAQKKQTCFICKLPGHNAPLCPDKWRRYHSTVNPNLNINHIVKYNNTKYCSVCAGRGHLAEQCKFAKIYLEYVPSTIQIKSHVKPIPSQPNSTILSNSTITYNLLYSPNNNIHFSFSFNKKFKLNQYYGRFLKAVKLEHLVYEKDFSEKSHIRKSETSSDPKNRAIDHQFKSPIATENNFVTSQEKNKISEKPNQSTEKDTMRAPSNDFVCDSDSNYSFSDHFDVPKSTPGKTAENAEVAFNFKEKANEIDLSKPQRIARPMGDLLDFIPLSSSEKTASGRFVTEKQKQGGILQKYHIEEENFIEFSENNYDLPNMSSNNSKDSTEETNNEQVSAFSGGMGISHKFRNLSESDFDENNFPEAACFGKIFLPKNFSDYLISPNGNKFLIENSMKYNVKSSIEWTSVGNVLVLEGLKENQNQFHIKLMLELRSLPKKIKNDLLEQSLCVPKKRKVLIKFLQEDLERLDSKIGNVFDLHKQLQIYEHQQSKNGLRQAQKIRTKLNMILLGQAGLRDGETNLEILLNHLIQLRQGNTNLLVSSQIRDEINKSWKYIFSPFEHSNYDELIDDYYDLKRNNLLPKLKIHDRIKKGRTSISLNSITNFTNENQFNNIKIELEKPENQLKRKENFTGLNELLNIKIPKLFLNITDTDSNSFSAFLAQSQLLDGINNQKNSQLEKKPSLSAKMPSSFWSKESSKYLTDILQTYNWNDAMKHKIITTLNYSTNGLLSHSDYKDVVSIRNFVNGLLS